MQLNEKGKTSSQGVCVQWAQTIVSSHIFYSLRVVLSLKIWIFLRRKHSTMEKMNKIFDYIFSKSLPKMSEQYLCRTIIAPSVFGDRYFSFLVSTEIDIFIASIDSTFVLFLQYFSIYFNWSGAVYHSTLHSPTLVHRTLEWLLSQFSVIEIRFREENWRRKGKILWNYLDANPSWMYTWCCSCSKWLFTCWINLVLKLLKTSFSSRVLGSEEIVYYSRCASNARIYPHRWSEKRSNWDELISAASSTWCPF